MNNNVKHAVQQHPVTFARLIVRSATASFVLVLLALGFSVPLASAATTVSPADQAFLVTAAQINLTEMKLGELALQNGQRDDVREFARTMMKDHMALNADLKVLAAQKEITLPETLDAENQKMVDKLTALTGADFDKAYIGGMYKGHKKAVKAFKAESTAATDLDVRNFVDKSTPVLEEHLRLITVLKKA
jgi:putative membrane protein